MSESLRPLVLYAMAKALAADVWHEAKRGPHPITGYPEDQAVLTIAADGEITGFNWARGSQVALDAALDTLEANAEVWSKAAMAVPSVPIPIDFIQALRPEVSDA